VTPAAPTPAPAPIQLAAGETVQVQADVVLDMAQPLPGGGTGNRFVRYRGSEQLKLAALSETEFWLLRDDTKSSYVLVLIVDPATGRFTGKLAGTSSLMDSQAAGQITRGPGGGLVIQGGFCAVMNPGTPEAARVRNIGARFWGPAGTPMPAGLPERADNLCGPDAPAAGPPVGEDTIENLEKSLR